MESNNRTLIFCVYNHVEYYPPSINALLVISKFFNEVHIVQRPYKKNEWTWPSNVYYRPIKKTINLRYFMNSSPLNKLYAFFLFTIDLFQAYKKNKPLVVITADTFSFFSWSICSLFLKKRAILWYHSHDAAEEKEIYSLFSIQYWAAFNERKNFHKLDFFSLPSVSRLGLYNLANFQGEIGIIPNYPLLEVFNRKSPREILENEITILFLGSICSGRGLEEIINLLPCKINNKEIKLKIIGFVNNQSYFDELSSLIARKKVEEWVTLEPPVAYKNLQNACEQANIGLGFYLSQSNLDRTIVTASNKIYEYAAMGIPVLSNIEIKNRIWCVTTEQNSIDIKRSIEFIVNDYSKISELALSDIKSELNFEKSFVPFIEKVIFRL